MALSVFDDESKKPDEEDLRGKLSNTMVIWKNIKDFIHKSYPTISEEWLYSKNKDGHLENIEDRSKQRRHFMKSIEKLV